MGKKVLLIDTCIDGHHYEYMKALAESIDNCIILVPEFVSIKCKKVIVYGFDIENDGFIQYLKWIKEIRKIAKEYEIDVIHFLTGDFMVKYFGVGLVSLKAYHTVLTFHHFKHSKLRDFARKCLSKKAIVNVVHTESLLKDARDYGMENFVRIDYPCFLINLGKTVIESKKTWGIPDDGEKVIAAIGATRYDKGLDILIAALKNIESPYHLLIAGKDDFFKREWIEEEISELKGKVHLIPKFLTDEEMYHAINAADIIVLPYRKTFDGASGPMTDGVAYGKCIIGPEHGSIGRMIREHHLGEVFETENTKDLERVISVSIKRDFNRDLEYTKFAERLSLNTFRIKYIELYKSITREDEFIHETNCRFHYKT